MQRSEENLDYYLGEMLTPVSLRRGFVTGLEDRLLADMPHNHEHPGAWQTVAIAAAGVLGLSLTLFTGIRVIILLSQRLAALRHSRLG